MDVMETIRTRRSVRSYNERRIPDETLRELLEAFHLAPSANNEQPWKLIVVREPEIKRKLAGVCYGQTFIAEADAVCVACGLPNRSKIGGYVTSLYVDVAIAVDHLTLAAWRHGLGTCWIGAFDENAVKKLLDIPADVRVIVLTPLGYPASRGGSARRKPLDEVVCWERYTSGRRDA
jgi:nitroreductase